MPSALAVEKNYDDSNKETKRKAEFEIQAKVFDDIRFFIQNNYVKGRMKRNFADIIEAKGNILSAITDLNAENFPSANAKLEAVIEVLKKALTEDNISEEKARVSKRISAMLNYNLALYYALKNDFGNAESHVNKSINIASTIKVGVFIVSDKTKENAGRLRDFIIDQKSRFEINK